LDLQNDKFTTKKFYTLETSKISKEVIEFVDKAYYFLKELIQTKTLEDLVKTL
jgi:hypothetical protein